MSYWVDQFSDQNGVGEKLVVKPRFWISAGAGWLGTGRVRLNE